MQIGVYSDFDGTITLRDCNDALVDMYIGRDRREAYDRLFLEDKGTLWEVLDTSMRACEVPLEQAIQYLVGEVPIDPTFEPFHAWCQAKGLPLAIVSAGLGEIIQAFLQNAGLVLPVTANQAHCQSTHFGLVPMDSACPTGVDKARVLREAKAQGIYTVFVGDGFSDRLAAPEADLVYAKTGMALAKYCTDRGIPFVAFDRFNEVQADLEARLANFQVL
jgi:2-hydroxy-3-keto-5-methylthiopentenyl-1-phosphate phosphatase